MIFAFLVPRMQTPQKGDALSPRPNDCIFENRTNEENTAGAGSVAAYGLGARPNVAKRRSSPGAEQEQVRGSFRCFPEGCREPHRGSQERQLAKSQVLRVVDPQRQPGFCILVATDSTPVRRAELSDRSPESTRFPERLPIAGNSRSNAVRRRSDQTRSALRRIDERHYH